MANYIGKKTLNELRRRGVKVPAPLTYEQIKKKVMSAFNQVRSTNDELRLDKSGNFQHMFNAKTDKEKAATVRKIAQYYDEDKLTWQQIAISLNVANWEEGLSPKNEKLRSDITRRTLNNDSIKKNEKIKALPERTPIQREEKYYRANMELKADMRDTYSAQLGRLRKSLQHYPKDLKDIVFAAIGAFGINVFARQQLSGSNAIQYLGAVLSSDNETIQGPGLNDIFYYFKVDELMYMYKDDDKVKGTNMTGKELNRKIDKVFLGL